MSLFRTRVEFLALTEPKQTWKLFVQNRKKLLREVEDRVDAALKYGDRLRNNPRLAPDQVDELVYNHVAPREVPEAREQLSEEKLLRLWEWASAPYEKKTETTS